MDKIRISLAGGSRIGMRGGGLMRREYGWGYTLKGGTAERGRGEAFNLIFGLDIKLDFFAGEGADSVGFVWLAFCFFLFVFFLEGKQG